MTVEELYAIALSFLAEVPRDQSTELNSFIVPWVNILLQEALPYENSILRYEDKVELAEAPVVQNMSDKLFYHDSIVRSAFPYGLASWLFQDDENDYRTEKYRNMYIAALNEAAKMTEESIADGYGG